MESDKGTGEDASDWEEGSTDMGRCGRERPSRVAAKGTKQAPPSEPLGLASRQSANTTF